MCSPGQTKKPGFMCRLDLNSVTRRHDESFDSYSHTQAQKLDQHVVFFVSLKSLFDQVNGFFLAACSSAAAESALLPGGSVVPRFRAFKWKIYFSRHTHYLNTAFIHSVPRTSQLLVLGFCRTDQTNVTSASHDCVTL